MANFMPRSPKKLGKRGMMIVAASILHIVWGAPHGNNILQDNTLIELLPSGMRMTLWLSFGIFGILWAFRPEWCPNDRIAFIVLYIMPLYQSVAWFLSYVHYVSDENHIGGTSYGYAEGCLWAFVCVALAIAMTWRETGPLSEVARKISDGEHDPEDL